MTPGSVIPVPKIEDDCYDWYVRHESRCRLAACCAFPVVLIGDSITHFWYCDDGPERGVAVWRELFGEVPALNLGFGFDRTQNVLWRLAHGEFAGQQPRLVVIHIGTNNLGGSPRLAPDSPEAAAAGVVAVVDAVRQLAPSARIVVMEIFPRGEAAGELTPRIRATNRLLRAALRGRENLTLLDLEPQLGLPEGGMNPAFSDDRCHPNAAGYRIWAAALRPELTRCGLMVNSPIGKEVPDA